MSGIRTYRNFDLKDTPSLSKKIAIVTGGNAGIGREIVAQLLLHGIAKVYVLARSAEKFEIARTHWKETYGLNISDGMVEFVTCDLSDMVVVKKVADDLAGRLGRLDILINNAGALLLLRTRYLLS
jgi:NAD(P)-dependent dehydrogenase (short-subunit alcohol dehydrogenase family)